MAQDAETENGGADRDPDEAAENSTDQESAESTDGEGGGGQSLADELKSAVREAALEVLRPAAREATTTATKYAATKGPELVTKNVMPAVMQRGGPGGMAQEALSKGGEALSKSGGVGGLVGKAVSALGGGKGGGEASGWGKGRRMPVQQDVYVSAPIKRAYTAWTEYKRWPEYMHRANTSDVDVDEEKVRVKVTEKMWGFKRPFSAEIISQQPDEYIRWRATEGTKHTGVINFHELGPRLTLVEVNIDHSPSGPIEKIARGARFVKRAVRADFHRYKAWIEMLGDDEEIEGWRGTIEDGVIVKSHEDAVEEEEQEAEEGSEGDESPEGDDEPSTDEELEGEEQPEGEEEPDEEGEAEEEPEAEEDAEEPEAEEDAESGTEEEQEDEPEPEPAASAPRAKRASPRPRRRSSGR